MSGWHLFLASTKQRYNCRMAEKELSSHHATFLDMLDNIVDASARHDRRAKRKSERWWGNLWVNARLYVRLLWISLFKSKDTNGPLKGRRIVFLLMFIPVWTIGQLIHWTFIFWDDLAHPDYRQQEIEKPLFIVGNFRSGSTFLQRLLAKDRRNFAVYRMWEIFLAPAIIERRFFRFLSRVDDALGGYGKKIAHHFDDSTMGNVDLHKVSFFAPEEDENVLLHTWTSSYLMFMFPYLDEIPDYFHFDEDLPEKRKHQIMFYFERMVKRHLFAHPESKHYLSKSPAFTAKIDCLYEQFDDARFLYLVRNPYETLGSTTSWLSYAWNVFSECPEQYVFTERMIPLLHHYYENALAKLEKNDPATYKIVRYEDLVADPEKTIRDVYEHFGYEMNNNFETLLHKEAERAKQYISTHEYDLEEMGFSKEQVYEEFKDIFERFGYEK